MGRNGKCHFQEVPSEGGELFPAVFSFLLAGVWTWRMELQQRFWVMEKGRAVG